MSRPSNRSILVEGALRCLERLPPERVTARAITRESGANLNSITHHFGAKENLVTEAMLLGLERWHQAVASRIAHLGHRDPAVRLGAAVELAGRLCRRYPGLTRNFIAALARAQHDQLVKERVADDLGRMRRQLAEGLPAGHGEMDLEAAALLQAVLVGTLAQTMVEGSGGSRRRPRQRATAAGRPPSGRGRRRRRPLTA